MINSYAYPVASINWSWRRRPGGWPWLLALAILFTLSAGTSIPIRADKPAGTIGLTSFTARCVRQQVLVSWVIASTADTTPFLVQRSSNGYQFITVATVRAVPSYNPQPHKYEVLDHAPLTGQNYYRIQQLSSTGAPTSSDIVALKWDPAFGRLVGNPYPNPTAESLLLPDFAGTLTYRVWNSGNNLVLVGQGIAGARLDLGGLPDGLYHLEMDTGPERVLRKFIKQGNP